MDYGLNDMILNLVKAEIEHQYLEKYSHNTEKNFTERWAFHFAKTKSIDKEVPEDPFLYGITRMLAYLDVDKKLLDLYILLTHATYDAKKPFRPLWGTTSFYVSCIGESTSTVSKMRFVTVREAILSEDIYRRFVDTHGSFGFKAILLGSSILLPDSNLIGCVWVHPEGSNQGYLVSDVKDCRYSAPFTAISFRMG